VALSWQPVILQPARHVETETPRKVIRLGTFQSSFSPVVCRNSYSVLTSKGEQRTAELSLREERDGKAEGRGDALAPCPPHLEAAPTRSPRVRSQPGEQPHSVLPGTVWTNPLLACAIRREGKQPMKVSQKIPRCFSVIVLDLFCEDP